MQRLSVDASVYLDGRAYQNFHAFLSLTIMRQNPSLMSSFDNRKGDPDRCLSSSTETMRLRACLSWFIEDCSASFSVLVLNELNCYPTFLMLKDRYLMHQKRRLLWGIMATSDNLSLACILSFISPHRTILANPFLDLSVVSSSRHQWASRSVYDGCA